MHESKTPSTSSGFLVILKVLAELISKAHGHTNPRHLFFRSVHHPQSFTERTIWKDCFRVRHHNCAFIFECVWISRIGCFMDSDNPLCFKSNKVYYSRSFSFYDSLWDFGLCRITLCRKLVFLNILTSKCIIKPQASACGFVYFIFFLDFATSVCRSRSL